MSFSALLDKTGTIQRQTATLDSSGSKVEGAWSDLLAGVPCAVQPCAVQPASARIRNDYAQRQQDVSHKVFTTTDLDAIGGLKLNDRWLVDGLSYLVVDYIPITNSIISDEGMFTTICRLIRD